MLWSFKNNLSKPFNGQSLTRGYVLLVSTYCITAPENPSQEDIKSYHILNTLCTWTIMLLLGTPCQWANWLTFLDFFGTYISGQEQLHFITFIRVSLTSSPGVLKVLATLKNSIRYAAYRGKFHWELGSLVGQTASRPVNPYVVGLYL